MVAMFIRSVSMTHIEHDRDNCTFQISKNSFVNTSSFIDTIQSKETLFHYYFISVSGNVFHSKYTTVYPGKYPFPDAFWGRQLI